MDEPATGSRKRPFEAVAGGGNPGATTGDGDLASGLAVAEGASRVGGVDAARRPPVGHRPSQAVSVGAGDESDGNDGGDRDVPEIADLQNALEYLVSERDVERIYNKGCEQQKAGGSKQSADAAASKQSRGTNDEQLHRIPNLVNRILMEYYSTNRHRTLGDNTKNIPRKQNKKMTQLLLAVIVEFSEPYFARAARRRQQERKELMRLQEQRKKEKPEKKKRARGEPQSVKAPPQDIQSEFAFEERAISWATSCISQLLQPPVPMTSPSRSREGGVASGKSDCDLRGDDPRIPELDALLATLGPHDGLELEEQLQRALMHGLQGRHRLQDMGMM